MESKHTPGPWEVRDEFSPYEYGTVEVYKEDGNKWIASALGTHVGPSTKEEAKANANLIAASPDLLEAIQHALNLKDLWSADQYGTVPSDYEGTKNALQQMQDKLEAAYLKATGQAITPVEA